MLFAAFLCFVTAVHDGDTLKCRDGTRVRLAAIDAPEMDREVCRRRRCTPGNAMASRDALRGMALRKTIRCKPNGRSYDRVTAWCSIGGADLSCAMVRAGQAVRRWDREGLLCRADHRRTRPSAR